MEINRFGLNYDFIIANNLSWINNLITGSGKNLASPTHPNHSMSYVQDYLAQVGERKCEANALVVAPTQGRLLCRQMIEKYVREGAIERFNNRWLVISREIGKLREETGVKTSVEEAIRIIDNGGKD